MSAARRARAPRPTPARPAHRVATLLLAAACGGGRDAVPGERGELKLESNADVHQAGAPAGVGPVSAETLGTTMGPNDTSRIPPGGFPTGVTNVPNQTGATGAPAIAPPATPRDTSRTGRP